MSVKRADVLMRLELLRLRQDPMACLCDSQLLLDCSSSLDIDSEPLFALVFFLRILIILNQENQVTNHLYNKI